ncbi:MAG: hypothetical protein WBC33_07875 [Conexibacter sp.]
MRIPFLSKATKSATAKRPLTLLAVSAVLAAVGGIAYVAVAAPPVPAPSITAGPTGTTSQTSASFAFKGSNGLTFQCSLDGAAFAACTSPKAYAGPLSNGSHTFQVRARNASGQLSSATSRNWTVDTQAPPAPQITSAPPSLAATKAATFKYTDAEAGVTYLCKLDGAAYASCPATKSYGNLAQGEHTFSVQARDAAGNTSGATSHTWTIDTVAPPRPNLTGRPNDPDPFDTATFVWSVSEAGVHFLCKDDGGPWTGCTSPHVRTGLKKGGHTFRVKTVDDAGNESPTADWEWRVTQQSGLPFNVSGNLTGLLAPGLSGTLALTVSNPNSEQIFITSLTVTVQAASTKPGCNGPANLQIQQSNASVAMPLAVPPHGSVTLPTGGITAPQVLMKNLPTNQDACKGATFTFDYGGSAHS